RTGSRSRSTIAPSWRRRSTGKAFFEEAAQPACRGGVREEGGTPMSEASDYGFHFMHFMPYVHLPDDFDDKGKYPSSWVELPNTLYDPEKGHALYKRYIDELVLAETVGFDGVVV